MVVLPSVLRRRVRSGPGSRGGVRKAGTDRPRARAAVASERTAEAKISDGDLIRLHPPDARSDNLLTPLPFDRLTGQTLAVDFTLAVAMCPPERAVPPARAAEAAGWDGIAVPDSVFFLEQVSAKYLFTPDGERFWAPETPFVDPLVAILAMAAVTERLRFVTNVLKTSLRHPLLVAKAVGSTAAMFHRAGWCWASAWSCIPEGFFRGWPGRSPPAASASTSRSKVIRALLAGGWVEHHGRHYDFDRLRMEPAPGPGVPILVGGHSPAAMARAARLGDGWMGARPIVTRWPSC